MPIEVTDASLSILIHGMSKSGKSTLSVTTPPPRLLFDVESASRFLDLKRVYWDPHTQAPPEASPGWDTCIVRTRSWEDVMAGYQWLASGQHPFKSVVIDSISELQARYIEKVGGRDQLTMQGWGQALREVGGLMRDLRDLTAHPTNPIQAICCTAMTKSEDGMWRPYLAGQLKTLAPYLFDITAYLYVEQVRDLDGGITETRRLLTRRTTEFEAGERVGGKLPAIIDNPDISDMITAIFGVPLPAPEV